MHTLKNKKGCTLVELLAVIVILAVIILIASTNVGTMMTTARKNTLAIEGNELINAAKNAYQMDILDGTVTGTTAKCYSLKSLHDDYGFFSKGPNDKYTGSVYVSPDADGKVVTYTFWISNGSYRVVGETGATGKNAVNATSASETCDISERNS